MDALILGVAAGITVALLLWGDWFWRRRCYLIGILIGVLGVALGCFIAFALSGGHE